LLFQAPSGGVTDAIDQACRSNERLTRNAAVIKAVASHLISFDECNPPAKCRCTGGGYQPGCAGADHNYIVWAETFRFAHSEQFVTTTSNAPRNPNTFKRSWRPVLFLKTSFDGAPLKALLTLAKARP
jgi:hypothetical protein